MDIVSAQRALPVVPPELCWLETRVAGYRKAILDLPFFEAVQGAEGPEDFAWARHLLHHSREFPQILAIRRDRNENAAHDEFLTEHVEVEAGHADMLTEWLHSHDLVPVGEPAASPTATPATTACIAQAFRTAVVGTNEVHIVSLNVALEAASFDFFNVLSPKLDELGIGHEYWRVHMELDEYHSADGLALLDPVTEDSLEGKELAAVARETILFWGFMLNSWAGIDAWPSLAEDA